MNDDAQIWLTYAEENLGAAKVTYEAKYFNPCLQEAQQCVEKSLKSILLAMNQRVKKTHSIRELKEIVLKQGQDVEISTEECHLLDSIYLPSKYPLGSCLPEADPDAEICKQCITIAERVFNSARYLCCLKLK